MDSVVIIQMTPLRGRKKQCQYFFCVERTIKEKQIILCALINNSAHTARRMNIMHIAQLTLFFKAEMGERSYGFLLFLSSDPSLTRIKRLCQNLKCDIERKNLEYDTDLGMELHSPTLSPNFYF